MFFILHRSDVDPWLGLFITILLPKIPATKLCHITSIMCTLYEIKVPFNIAYFKKTARATIVSILVKRVSEK